MAHEGMVHALETIHTLLKPDGALIDIHPIPEGYFIKVLQGKKNFFAERKRDTLSEDVLAADRAIAIILQRSLYSLEQALEIDYFTYGASVDELREYWEEQNEFDADSIDKETAKREEELFTQADKVMRTIGGDAQIAIHERATVSRLIPLYH